MIPIAQPLIGEEERQAVLQVLDSGVLAQGPRVQAFEQAFADMCGVRYAVATSSGTTALHVALLAYGIGIGHEVITTPFTFIASANSIRYTGARPVFVDIDPVTLNLDPSNIESAITPHTRAIMPVHLFGLMCDMDPILALADAYNLVVIEDACQAHGAEYKGKRAGSLGTGCFSLYPTKNITSAEGGMITLDDPEIADRCRVLRQHGMRRRYYHDDTGFNFRMTDVHAAIGLAQLPKLARFNEARVSNAAFYTEHLRNVGTPTVPSGHRHVFHQYTIRVRDGQRDSVLAGLAERGIAAGVYYPVPVHHQPPYQEQEAANSYPAAECAALEVLSLPVHPGLSLEDLETVVASVNELTR
jgi:dTDP-4-amino-4,6-dideoxygalactose transaminase